MENEQNCVFEVKDRGIVESVPGFIEQFFKLRQEINNKKLLFRGEADHCNELRPTIGRSVGYFSATKAYSDWNEMDLLHRFRRRAFPHLGRDVTAGEALFHARHHGLPTRLLDWTANALFALYFACREDNKQDKTGVVYAILNRTENREHILNPYEIARLDSESQVVEHFATDKRKPVGGEKTEHWIKIVYPIFTSPRIVAQDSAFTIHSNPSIGVAQYAGARFWPNRLDIDALFHWCVASKRKEEIIRQLSGLGITYRAVFPDLDGIAKSLWETDVLWVKQ